MADEASSLPPLDGSLLEEPLEGAPLEEADSEEPDTRVDDVADRVGNGDYAEAARMAEALLRAEVRDVRLISPYLFGVFHEKGLQAMPGLFRSIIVTLTKSWDAFGPPEKKVVLTANGLRWLLKTLNKHLLHHEKLKDSRWKQLGEPANRAPLEEAIPLAGQVLAALDETLPESGCDKPFRALVAWLNDHLRTLPAPSAPEQKASPAPAKPASVSEPEQEPEDEQVAPSTTSPVRRAASSAPAAEPGLPISPPMALLLRKLEAFNVLVERQDFLKAGVVAMDVLATVERFDPRLYLPMIFSRFYAGLSTHAETFEPLLQSTESLAFRSLDQLFRVDLEAFLAQAEQAEE
ncbi:type VI secretion system protein IglI family protein [Hyalangium rubrum]|uniref:Type VI secretion system protein IglI family protein n=1 Tax=Hyalangium rubrum TaxID=3103134 RepID=A0ABU5HLT6_9BACT|nr:type VI secretion system protein IglI family protein [Hyalangium sp. s54d21]MDY7233065.1 type VI secretion system protein IglI family protein [Hyalangium sp. s54d21]